jgi:UDPglucose 6-dehydrogenase
VICDKVGADVRNVARGIGYDTRIGPSFLNAGVGYGGFCFPKDLEAFIRIAEKLGYDFKLLKAVKQINDEQRGILVEKVSHLLWNLKGKKVGLLGLSFKPDTDDLRFAPSLEIIAALEKGGARIHAYDPQAMPEAKHLLGRQVRMAKDPYALAREADCLVLVTEWKEFKDLDFVRIKKLMRQPVLVDGRNMYDPAKMKRLGFRYTAMGRGRTV